MSQNRKKSAFEPNTTQVPNFIFEMIPRLSEAELKVLMIIIRKTYGWHKDSDRISAGQLESATGLSYSAIKKARSSLKAKGIHLVRSNGNGRAITEYCRPVPLEDPLESGCTQQGPPGGHGEDPQGGHKEALTKDTSNKRHLKQKTLSLEAEPDTKTNVLKIKTEFLSLAGNGARWGAKQTKIATTLLKDFSPEHICANMKILRDECLAKKGQYGWAFSMEKLNWKWEDVETIKQADEEETAELMRLGGYEYTPAHLRKQA